MCAVYFESTRYGCGVGTVRLGVIGFEAASSGTAKLKGAWLASVGFDGWALRGRSLRSRARRKRAFNGGAINKQTSGAVATQCCLVGRGRQGQFFESRILGISDSQAANG
ncbi:hypothetical protein Trco_008279 [Trichoderma cornu-damae]|uniref:Uncharacterized protein n=1 Tax=Trichoderma cornu-damae TaxID=654480 RepID=A0A9P8TTW8_9HYPO|nr:hypothetical protein Trco_008279 [Trichoderma cornu-damae]